MKAVLHTNAGSPVRTLFGAGRPDLVKAGNYRRCEQTEAGHEWSMARAGPKPDDPWWQGCNVCQSVRIAPPGAG